MKRYKRDWVMVYDKILKLNLYKNGSGDVFISFEGEWQRLYKSSCSEYWKFKEE